MEDAASLEAKQIISQYMSSDSVALLTDVSFSEREHLAELRKQIELRKAYRDSLRSLNLGLYALKQGMGRYGSDTFEEQLAKQYHAAVRQVVEKQREATHELQQPCYEYTLLGNSRQALIEQAELQKLQGVMRLQDQLHGKIASTRVVKQWEREKATLLSEQKEISKLHNVGKEIMQKRKEMLDRKHGEIANILICIGEGVEKADELRMKLAEITKQHRDDLHDDNSSDADLRSEDGRKDAGENDKDTSSAPMFGSIDWNLGSVSMDLQLDFNFKNPNDFPDILTHLSSINTSKFQLKAAKPQNVVVGNSGKQNTRKADERNKLSHKGNKQASGSTSSSEHSLDDATATKKAKLDDSTEKVLRQVVGSGNENAKNTDNREKYEQRAKLTAQKPMPKQNNENVTNMNNKVMRKKVQLSAQHETSPSQAPKASPTRKSTPLITGAGAQDVKKAQELDSGSTPVRYRTPANKTYNAVASSNPSKIKRESPTREQQQRVVQVEKKYIPQQKQQSVKRNRSLKMLSPISTNQQKLAQKQHQSTADGIEPTTTPMEVESEDVQNVETTTSNTSLDFGMQSGNSEFDMNYSDDFRPCSEASADDDLDFLSINPGRVTRSKGQKKKTGGTSNSTKSSGSGGDDMDAFDFTFGGSNSSESLEQPDDLF